jgi:hypothetical protein
MSELPPETTPETTPETAPKATPKAAPLPAPKPARPPVGPAIRDALWLLVILLLELLLPVLITGAAAWLLFSYFSLWRFNPTLMIVLYGILVTVAALGLSVTIDRLLDGLRRRHFKHGVKLGKSPNARMIKMALGGLVIPIALVVAASQVRLPASLLPGDTTAGDKTAMQYLTSVSVRPVVVTPPDEVGKLALATDNPSTKILSIRVLQSFGSAEGMNQLLRIAGEDEAALRDAGVRAALSQAIASYGAKARDPLMQIFTAAPVGSSLPASGDVYDRYFAPSFTALEAEISASTLDETQKQQRLSALQAAHAHLQEDLSTIEQPASDSGDLRQAFVLQTLLAMDLKSDGDLLSFAKGTASDPKYPSAVRGDALLLIGKLGDAKALEGLYPYLQNEDPLIQNRALQAILALQKKMGASVGNTK